MQVILLDKIGNLGGLGDQVNDALVTVSRVVVMATKENVAMFETRRAELEAKVAEAANLVKLVRRQLTL